MFPVLYLTVFFFNVRVVVIQNIWEELKIRSLMTEESKETTITENSTTILKELRRSCHFEGMAPSFMCIFWIA